jgi:hypothetical protein
LTNTMILALCGAVSSRWLSKVVFPAPKNPEITYIGVGIGCYSNLKNRLHFQRSGM